LKEKKRMPYYRVEGKVLEPYTAEDFKKGMDTGPFLKRRHRALIVLYYYTGVRKTEATRSLKEQFRISRDAIYFDVGKRLKHGKSTPPLKLPRAAAYMEELVTAVQHTRQGQRVFPYSPRTAYAIVRRVFKYPHLFRLSRITTFFEQGYTISQVKNWTGLTVGALEYYVGKVDTDKMGDSLVGKRSSG
jgi:integrase